MSFGDMFDKAKGKYNDYQANQQAKKEAEEARKQKILSGDIPSLNVPCTLEPDERAYCVLDAKRMALVDSIVEHTTGKSKKKGVVGRAVVGGLLLGPLGALGGAATAGSRDNSTTTQSVVTKIQAIDNGKVYLTNHRLLFVGNEICSLPYKQLMGINFRYKFPTNIIDVQYDGMQKGEHYAIGGEASKDAELYYKGIQKLA